MRTRLESLLDEENAHLRKQLILLKDENRRLRALVDRFSATAAKIDVFGPLRMFLAATKSEGSL